MTQQAHADVIVIGAGISGLATAFWLQNKGRDVLILEKNEHFGGAMRSWRKDGFLVEEGPNSTLETTPLLTAMIQQAGVEDKKCYASEASNKRFILKRSELVPLPMSPPAFFTTKLFSIGTKLSLFREPFIPPSRPDSTETVADFVRRRLNREFLDYAINPFVAGVYAGDPERLSVRAAFPKLFEIEQKYGGLIKGQIKGARERKKNPEKSKQRAKMFSFLDGMETLPHAIASKIRRKEHSATIVSIEKTDAGFAVEASIGGENRRYTCRSLVVATPALQAAELVRGIAPQVEAPLKEIIYPPVAVVISAFRKEDIRHPLDGFGFLIPQAENREILGTIFSSTIFPGRAQEGYALLTSFVGGMRQPQNAQLSGGEIIALTLREQQALLGTPTEPVFTHVTAWDRAIPQYSPGHLERIASIEEAERTVPGLFFCANYRGGISVGDCTKSADKMVHTVDEWMKAL